MTKNGGQRTSGLKPSSATYKLCDLGKFTEPLCASAFSSKMVTAVVPIPQGLVEIKVFTVPGTDVCHYYFIIHKQLEDTQIVM